MKTRSKWPMTDLMDFLQAKSPFLGVMCISTVGIAIIAIATKKLWEFAAVLRRSTNATTTTNIATTEYYYANFIFWVNFLFIIIRNTQKWYKWSVAVAVLKLWNWDSEIWQLRTVTSDSDKQNFILTDAKSGKAQSQVTVPDPDPESHGRTR